MLPGAQIKPYLILKMKSLYTDRNRHWLVWSLLLIIAGSYLSCNQDDIWDKKAEVTLNIVLPVNNELKSAVTTAGIRSVRITVTSGNEVLAERELTVSGRTARGTVLIRPGSNIKFSVEAMDENDIIQWEGNATINVDKDFSVDIELNPILPLSGNLQASLTDRIVQLTWTQNTDTDFARYELHRSESQDELGDTIFSTTDITVTEFTDSLETQGNTLFYNLVIFDTEGFNTKSNLAQIDVPNFDPDASTLTGLRDSLSVNLSWTPNTDPDFAKYDLYRSEEENVLGDIIYSTTNISENEYLDEMLTQGSTYYYTLVTTDSDGLNSESNPVTIVIPNFLPTAGILTGSIDSLSVILRWTQNSDPDFAGYDLYRSQDENVIGDVIYSTVNTEETIYTDSLLSQASTYFYTLVTLDSEGLSSESNRFLAEIPDYVPTASILEGYTDSTVVYLSWTRNPDSDFARYELYRSGSNESLGEIIHSSNGPDETDFTDNSVMENYTYYYTIIVFDAAGTGTESNIVPISMPNLPPDASELMVVSKNNDWITLSWTQNSNIDFNRYELQRDEEYYGSEIIFQSGDAAFTEFEDTTFYLYSSNVYTLIVYDSEGLSSKSNEVLVDAFPPEKSILREDSLIYNYETYNHDAYLSWNPNEENDFAGYELYRSVDTYDNFERIFATEDNKETTFKDLGLEYERVYYYILVVYDTDGFYAESELTIDLTYSEGY